MRRYRRRLTRQLWAGSVRPCGGAENCPWSNQEAPCDCRQGFPCNCERRLFRHLEQEAEAHFGGVIAGLVTTSLLDLARELHRGEEAAIRESRIRLVRVLLDDQRRRRSQELAERKLEIEATRKPRSYSQVLSELVTGGEGEDNAGSQPGDS